MRRLLATAVVVIISTQLAVVNAQAPPPPPRANPVIKLLEQGKPAFSIWANYIGVGKDYHAAVTLQNNKNYDFILYDLEHDPLDVEGLCQFLRALLDPAAIAGLPARAILIDGRNAVASRDWRDAGWHYVGMGRP